jgi:hypothetical protein
MVALLMLESSQITARNLAEVWRERAKIGLGGQIVHISTQTSATTSAISFGIVVRPY